MFHHYFQHNVNNTRQRRQTKMARKSRMIMARHVVDQPRYNVHCTYERSPYEVRGAPNSSDTCSGQMLIVDLPDCFIFETGAIVPLSVLMPKLKILHCLLRQKRSFPFGTVNLNILLPLNRTLW